MVQPELADTPHPEKEQACKTGKYGADTAQKYEDAFLHTFRKRRVGIAETNRAGFGIGDR
jgi:hypothetical protein